MQFHVKEEATGRAFTSSYKIAESLAGLKQADQESFWLIGLDVSNKEILRECVFLGGLASSIVDPWIIFRRLLMVGCAAFLVAHNHPSGDVIPSRADIEITDRLKEGAEILGLVFLDHIIIGDGRYSFSENN